MPQVTENIYFIPGQDEFIPDSHVYVIGQRDYRDLSLVDAGLMAKGSYKISAIQEEGFKLEDIKRVIMTHTHLDHIGCLAEIRAKLPWAELWVHEEEALALEGGDERTDYGMEAFRSMCQAQYNLKKGDFFFRVNRKLRGGEKLNIGGLTWEVLHIPGHSKGSIALYDSEAKVLIPGDVVYADYAIGRFDLHGANGATLKNSLLRLAELEVKILLPGHNRIVKDVKPGYILSTAKEWGAYLG
jgi:glyoxylase-like metal-dependent hydrolase (beta-lactamase superfamily II)